MFGIFTYENDDDQILYNRKRKKKSTEKVESLTRIKIIAMIFSISSYEIFLHHHHLDQFIIDRGSNFIWLTKIHCSLIECMYVFYFQKKIQFHLKSDQQQKKNFFFEILIEKKKWKTFSGNWKKNFPERMIFLCWIHQTTHHLQIIVGEKKIK